MNFDTSEYIIIPENPIKTQGYRHALDDVRNLINTLDTSNLSGHEVRKLLYRSLDKLEPTT